MTQTLPKGVPSAAQQGHSGSADNSTGALRKNGSERHLGVARSYRMMEQHQRSGGSRNRRKKAKAKAEPKSKPEPVMIVARRPDSPLLMKVSNRNIAASARPKRARESGEARSSEE